MIQTFISIIIPVKNFERTIEKTFQYLMRVDYPHENWEWVIADGGSNDKTVEIIKGWQKKYPFIKLVEIPNCPSPGYARNQALRVVKGEFIFFTDADCAPCKEWVREILSHFERDPGIGAVGGEVFTLKVDPNNLVEAWCENFRFNMVSSRYGFIKEGYFPSFPENSRPVDAAGHRAYFFGTCNVAYRKAAMQEIRAKFWERPTGEDMDLSFQHRSKGWKFYFAPKAKVDHMHRANLKALRKVWVSYGQAHPPLIAKYVKDRGIEIVFQFVKSWPSVFIPLPIKGFVYLGSFHLLNIGGLLFVLSLIALFFFWHAGLLVFSGALFLLTLYFTFQYLKHNIYMEPRNKFLVWCKMKYLTNLSFVIGGLKGFKQDKVFCIEPSF